MQKNFQHLPVFDTLAITTYATVVQTVVKLSVALTAESTQVAAIFLIRMQWNYISFLVILTEIDLKF